MKELGQHFTSPCKPRDKKRACISVPIPGHSSKQQKLLDEVDHLLAAQPSESKLSPSSGVETAFPVPQFEELPEAFSADPEDMLSSHDGEVPCSTTVECVRTSCPNTRSISICAGWKALILSNIDPFLQYMANSFGQPLAALSSQLSSCMSNCQEQKLTTVLCLFFDRR